MASIDKYTALIEEMAWCQTGDKPSAKTIINQITDTLPVATFTSMDKL